MQSNWYEHFFCGVVLDVWRKAVAPQQTRAEADSLEKALQPAPGERLLDVPCGNGRHRSELAARGYRTTGRVKHAGPLQLPRPGTLPVRRATADTSGAESGHAWSGEREDVNTRFPRRRTRGERFSCLFRDGIDDSAFA